MIRSRLILLSLTLAVGALWASSAYAQPRYYPTQGPISPWMNMWQRKPGPLDNYHTYVQPEMQLQGVVSQQHKALMRNAAGIQTLGEAMEGANRQDQVRATGTGSVFMEYSHYYPMGARGSMGRSRSLPMHRTMPSSGTRYAR